uniref:Thiol:disulfide interchange protein n=1 Tax=Chondria sp. (in: red algae) TaxID=1982705 RepID=A0A1Z1MD24_9FLOR|nr:thiol:disulfide interchange protein [Chondria sp. (in: red algae)]
MIYLHNLFDQYQIFVYLSYQSIYKLFFLNYSDINFLLFIILLILGCLTILTPCFVSLLPVVLTYIYSNQSYNFNKYLFVLGVMTSTLFILLLSNVVNLYPLYSKLPIFSSVLLILISLNLMQIINLTFIPSLLYTRMDHINSNHLNMQSYIVGLITGVSSLPCNTSIILLIVFLLKQLDNLSFLYILIYLLGCLLPLLLITNIQIDYKKFNLLFQFWESVFPVSGSFLLFFSFLILLRSLFL